MPYTSEQVRHRAHTGPQHGNKAHDHQNGNRKLFDKNDEHIIAYAEMYSGTTVTEYKKFELNLDYRVTNRVPTYIVIVCSASKYGDYFVGGRGSTLHVDEFSLDYDY